MPKTLHPLLLLSSGSLEADRRRRLTELTELTELMHLKELTQLTKLTEVSELIVPQTLHPPLLLSSVSLDAD